jgi:hypothetical protein
MSEEQAFLCIPRLSALNTRYNGTDPRTQACGDTVWQGVPRGLLQCKLLPEILLLVYGRIGFLSSQAPLSTELRGFPLAHT